jgi:hypothetical protein
MGYLALGCRALLGVVFAAAVVGKTYDRNAFAEFMTGIRELRLIPHRRCGVVAGTVVVLEAAVVALLAAPWTVPWGFALAAVLLTGFAATTAVTLRREIAATCRCFGPSRSRLGPRHVIRNLTLLGVCALGLAATLGANAPMAAPGQWLAVAAGAMTALLVVWLDDIVDLFTAPV